MKEARMKFSRRQALAMVAAVSLSGMLQLAQAADAPQVLLKTNMGDIVLELNQEKAPKSVENFVQYVKSGQYNGTIFHRVIDGFMIQGGGFDKDMKEKATRAPIQNEAANGLKNDIYTIAMARTSAPHSATAQFFINTANNSMLNYPSRDGWGYAVFGKVIKGTEVVDKIKNVSTGNRGGHQNVPTTPVVIESASVIN
jgi:peptidyl-prolyl cis-trans isomerase A (cyclophilin A)/peptidyl-prolyl cis-trans isomerase B (cyclophilin B)